MPKVGPAPSVRRFLSSERLVAQEGVPFSLQVQCAKQVTKRALSDGKVECANA